MEKPAVVRKRRAYPHGCALDPEQVANNFIEDNVGTSHDTDRTVESDMFVTMCFFARLGFVQPPSCLKCGYHSSGCGENKKDDDKSSNSTKDDDCCELVAWRRDANIPLHPDKLEGNIVFLTCDTAKCLVNGDAYPSIRWDSRNKRLLHEI